ncbi:benenodin family lasso peptide [Novosphingobium naphthalenivorans]|nr:benenodin family lasso peptide [Novosphingobium naphthalenivorans]
MEREDDLIDLGTASVETKGPAGPVEDFAIGQVLAGLSDD